MRIWNSILEARQELAKTKQSTVITIGNFDGIHLGHQEIMRRTVELAKAKNALATVFSFSNHSESIFSEQPFLINTPQIRQKLLEQQEIGALLEIEFDYRFAKIEPEEFFEKWLVEGLHVQALVVGYDFKFGAEGRGDFTLLKELGSKYDIEIQKVAPIYQQNTVISSSYIRQLLAEGHIEKANQMLGYYFVLEGEVISGEKRGRNLGYPTANLQLDPEYLLPCYGVYLVRLTTEAKCFYGIANVGIKPTFGKYRPLVEVYLFDVEINLYHKPVKVEFIKFIRPENRFSGPESLKNQIARDVAAAKELLLEFT